MISVDELVTIQRKYQLSGADVKHDTQLLIAAIETYRSQLAVQWMLDDLEIEIKPLGVAAFRYHNPKLSTAIIESYIDQPIAIIFKKGDDVKITPLLLPVWRNVQINLPIKSITKAIDVLDVMLETTKAWLRRASVKATPCLLVTEIVNVFEEHRDYWFNRGCRLHAVIGSKTPKRMYLERATVAGYIQRRWWFEVTTKAGKTLARIGPIRFDQGVHQHRTFQTAAGLDTFLCTLRDMV